MNLSVLLRELFAVKIFVHRNSLEFEGTRVRLCKTSDLPKLYDLFSLSDLPQTLGIGKSAFRSFWFFKRWIDTTFTLFYLIESECGKAYRVIGFMGLYNGVLGESIWVSEALFDQGDRSQGRGGNALRLLLDLLREKALAKEVYAEVKKDNVRSLRLFKRVGFCVYQESGDSFFLIICLD